MVDVFVSYRRNDTRADAGRLYDRLSARFGDEHVFMDVDDIEPGEDFPQVLENTLARCNALLVLIGPSWLNAAAADGGTRLQDPADFVHMEVSRALARGIAVIPVLVGGASMPEAQSLPPALRNLCRRQALRISHERFHRDVDILIEALQESSSFWTWAKQRLRVKSRRLAALVLVLLVLALVAVLKPLLDSGEREGQVRTHVQVAEAFMAEGRLEPAIAEYRQALALQPTEWALQQRLVELIAERLQREAFLSAGSALDVALRADYQRFAPVPAAEVDSALREVSVLAALDPALAEDADHLLLRAMVLKSSGARIKETLALLEQAHALAPDHLGVMSELGLVRSVVMGDEAGLALLRQAAEKAPQDARIQFYLGRAYGVLHECVNAGAEIRRPTAPEACANGLRAYYRAALNAAAADPWSRHIRISALRNMQDLFRRYVEASGSIVTFGSPLSLPERVQMVELMLAGERVGARGKAEEHPAFWLALLYEASGRREEAGTRLRELMETTGDSYPPWRALQQRLQAGGD